MFVYVTKRRINVKKIRSQTGYNIEQRVAGVLNDLLLDLFVNL